MTRVTSLKSLKLIPGMRHVTFACGHHMLMTDKNPLLEVGSDMVCEACVRGERTILSVTPAWAMSDVVRHVNMRFECGHTMLNVPLKPPFTAENVGEIEVDPCVKTVSQPVGREHVLFLVRQASSGYTGRWHAADARRAG